MDPDPASAIILLLALFWIGTVVAAEISLSSVKQTELKFLALQGRSRDALRAQMISRIGDNLGNFLTTTMLLKIIGCLVAGAAIAAMYPAGFTSSAIWFALFFLALLIAALQLIARNITLKQVLFTALQSAPIMDVVAQITWPIAAALRWVSRRAAGDIQTSEDRSIFLTEEGLQFLFDVSAADASIKEREKQMITNILAMENTVAREVMVPRIDVIAINVESDIDDALDVILDAGHSRIPVYEGDIDRVIGFLYAKDVLQSFHEESARTSIRGLMRSPYFVPISKKVNSLFREMQKQRVHMAMIVDEYGGTAGLVTIEDLLEEIVGDIQDEHDSEEHTYIETVAPNTYVINARLAVESIGKMLELDLPDEHANTLGGFLYSLLGHVPIQGEQAEWKNWRFTILSLKERRIDDVRVEPIAVPIHDAPIPERKKHLPRREQPSRFLLFGSGSSN